MKILVCERWDQVEKLQPQWNELLRKSAADTFFLTWEWLSSWRKAYAPDLEPFILCAWREEELIGIAPFCAQRVRRAGRTWRVLKFIGDGSHDSDYLDCFSVPAHQPEFARSVVEYLNSHRDAWDCLDLHGPLASSPVATSVITAVEQIGWKSVQHDVPCLTLKLPRSWDEYLQILKPRFRTKLRSCITFFEQQVKPSITVCTNEEQLRIWLDEFFILHGRRWNSKGRPGVFCGEEKRNFYWNVSRAALQSGSLEFHRLAWGERTLAYQYGFRYNNRFLLLQEAYDPDWETLRPGIALRGFRLRQMIGEGVQEYDFLGGVAQHKLDWGAEPKQSVRICAAASVPAVAAFITAPAAGERVKNVVRSILPRTAIAALQRMRTQHSTPRDVVSSEPQMKSAIARAYAFTPVSAIGGWIADHYRRGASPFRLRRREAPSCQILLYHRINDDHDPFLPSLDTKQFRQQMECISRNFRVVTLDDLAADRFGDNKARHCVAITFDDGYRDNFTNAFPILREFGLPATIFLATGYIGTGRIPWYDQVCLAFKLSMRTELHCDVAGAPSGSLQTREARLKLLERTLDWLRDLENERLQDVLKALFHALNVPSPLALPNYMLGWDEVRQMKGANISFGAHTVSHPVLSRANSQTLQREIVESKQTIEKKLQVEVRHFAYPFGRIEHFNQAAKECLKTNGFTTAVTTEYGFNEPGDDLLALKRFTPWGPRIEDFRLQFDWYRFAGFEPVQKDQSTPMRSQTARALKDVS